MSKNLLICDLLELYGKLLTKKQLKLLELYYFDDLSLSEITPTEKAQSIKSDKTIFSLRASSFSDVIPAQSFRIYVEGNGGSFEDTEIPFE